MGVGLETFWTDTKGVTYVSVAVLLMSIVRCSALCPVQWFMDGLGCAALRLMFAVAILIRRFDHAQRQAPPRRITVF